MSFAIKRFCHLGNVGNGKLAGVGAALALALAGCTSGAAPAPVPPPKIALQPGVGSTNIPPNSQPAVTVSGGKLDGVTLTSSDGKKIAGTLARDQRSWTVSEPLDYNKTYTWSGTAKHPGAQPVPVGGSFTTVNPANVVRGTLNIDDQQTVGVGAPISIDFDGKVDDSAKPAVERALSVQTSVPTEGSWAWLPDSQEGNSRVHWRPKDYWKPGTNVTVNAGLFGIPMGNGNYGKENLTSHFTVGRSQVVKADVTSHQMVIMRDGQQVASYPASYGLDSSPDRNTRSGTHVVMGKAEDQRMTSPQYGYDVVEHWAVRISNNGEFIHANPESTGNQGSSNVTHGCVNLSTDNAREYFDTVLYGDPVEVTNSGIQLSEADGDIYDWTVPWDKWQGMSALKQAPPAPQAQGVQHQPA